MTFTIREPGSALTHLAGAVLAVIAAFPLLIKSALTGDKDVVLGSLFAV